MTFISGVISIIIQKNTLCKIRVIYFVLNCVNFLPVKPSFFLFFIFGRAAAPLYPPARAPLLKAK